MMSKQVKKALVPKLRFPEFKDAGAWEENPLEKLYSFKVTNSLSRDKLNYENGSVKNIHYGDIHTKFSTLFKIDSEIVPFIDSSVSLEKIKPDNFCIEGDMIFADASEDLDDVGKSIEIIYLNNEKLLSGLHTLLARQKRKLIVGFGGYLFKSNRIREQIKKESQGAKVLSVSAGRLLSIQIAYPLDKKEQQKIADCLSSLDDLITVHAQKCDALKAHKKGLMQQLFPATGKTTPKLRFPEFKDAGEWEKKKLGNLFFNRQETGYLTLPLLSLTNKEGIILQEYSNRRNNSNTDKSKYLRVCHEDIAYNTMRMWEGRSALVGIEGLVSPAYTICKPSSDTNGAFFSFYFKTYQLIKEFHRYSQGLVKDTLSLKFMAFSKITVATTSLLEQQKIADFLSSLDDLITAYAQKHDALKAHKKGLMQQLFPATDEVEE